MLNIELSAWSHGAVKRSYHERRNGTRNPYPGIGTRPAQVFRAESSADAIDPPLNVESSWRDVSFIVVPIWVALASCRVLFYALEGSRHPELVAPVWADAIVGASVAPLVVIGCYLTLRAWRWRGTMPAVFAALATALVFGAAIRPLHAMVLVTTSNHPGAAEWLSGMLNPTPAFGSAWLSTILEYGAMYLSAVGAAVGFLSFRGLMNERLHRTKLQAAAAQERLRALRAQVNPHFLFNVLNSIVGATHEQSHAIRPLIERLSGLLRQTLAASEHEEGELGDEMAVIESYLAIEQIRRPGRIEWDAQMDPQCLHAIIPPLLLLPLVENAVKHGLRGDVRRVDIRISATCCVTNLLVTVTNTCSASTGGTNVTESENVDSGLGLRNLQEQLRVQYGSEALLLAQRVEPECFEVRVLLPWREGTPRINERNPCES